MPNSYLVESDKYNSADSNSNRTRHMGRVLPQLLGSGVSRSNSKPGAALAAAAAASRSIPTPHATAIKLRRATTTILQSPVSETLGKNLSSDDSSLSPSIVVSRVSEVSNADSEQLPPISISSDAGDDALPEYSAQDRLSENTYGVAVTLTEADDEDSMMNLDEREMPTLESNNSSPVEKEEDLVLDETIVNEEISPPLSDETDEKYPDVGPVDDSGDNNRMVPPVPILKDFDNEDTIGGEANDSGNAKAEHDDENSSQTDVIDILKDAVTLGENKRSDTNYKEKSHSLLKPLDLAEEIEMKQAFTGLHYEEGAAAQPMRLEGTGRGSTVIGYFDVESNNSVTRTISSQAFRRDQGSPQVLAVHFNYIAVGMSTGSIYVVPSKYTAHHVDNMDAKVQYFIEIFICFN